MSIYAEFARRFLEEARADLARARRALADEDYPLALFEAQQAAEKAVKAMLEAHRVWVRNHGPELVNEVLRTLAGVLPRNELEYVVEVLAELSEWYTRSRYPTVIRGRVYSPGELVTRDLAVSAVEKAEGVVAIAERVLRQMHVL